MRLHFLFAGLFCVLTLTAGCKVTLWLERLDEATPTPAVTATPFPTSTAFPTTTVTTPTATTASAPTPTATVTSTPAGIGYDMTVLDFQAVTSVTEVGDHVTDNSWIVVARPLPQPYLKTTVVTETESNGWIIISPDPQLGVISRIHERNAQNTTFAVRHVVEVLLAESTDYAALLDVLAGWHDESTDAVLWVYEIFIGSTGTLYSVIPSERESIALSPYDLQCNLANWSNNSGNCQLGNRFMPQETASISATYRTDFSINLGFVARATVITQTTTLNQYGECDASQELCILKELPIPDPTALQRYVCIDVLQCHIDSTRNGCSVWSCSSIR